MAARLLIHSHTSYFSFKRLKPNEKRGLTSMYVIVRVHLFSIFTIKTPRTLAAFAPLALLIMLVLSILSV